MNKFEQVSSLSHQMSLALGLGPYTGEGQCPVQRGEGGQIRGPCTVSSNALWVDSNGHMGPPSPMDRQIDRHINN